jgi:hypothetical protein
MGYPINAEAVLDSVRVARARAVDFMVTVLLIVFKSTLSRHQISQTKCQPRSALCFELPNDESRPERPVV